MGAKILGAVTIGDGAKIGAGAVVLSDVPAFATAVGVPAKVVSYQEPDGSSRRVEHLPDPELDMIAALQRRVGELSERVELLERLLREREAPTPCRGAAALSENSGHLPDN